MTVAGLTLRPNALRAPVYVWLPALAVAVLMLLPVLHLAVRSWEGGSDSVDLVLRSSTRGLLVRTAMLAATVALASAAISLPLAWLTVRTDLPLRRFWTVATILPLVVPSYVGAYVVVAALGPRGMVQGWLEPLGVERLPSIYGFWGAALTLTAFTFPYMLLVVRAALRNLDPAAEEASRALGKGPLETFARVTIPQLRPGLAAGGLLVALYVLSDFGAVSLLRFDSFTRVIYINRLTSFDASAAATLSMVLIALTAFVVALESFSAGRGKYYRQGAGAARQPRLHRLGRWKWPALGFCTAVVLLSLVLPIAVIAYWLIRGVSQGEELGWVWSSAWNSMLASGLAAAVCVVCALPVAILAVRYPGPLSKLIERVTYLGFALPGIVIALALVFFGIRYTPFLYQSLAMLIFAYTIRFLPEALAAVRTSLLQVRPSLEDAAHGLGRRTPSVFATITVPLARPGVAAGAALVFLTAMKELPATIFLAPIGFDTLAVSIWSASSEAFFARAAAPALILIGVAAIPTALLALKEAQFGHD